LSAEYPQARAELDLQPAREVDIEALAEKKTTQVEQRAQLTREVLASVAGNDASVKEQLQASITQCGASALLDTHVLYGCIAEDKGLQFLAEFLQPRGWVEDLALRQKSSTKSSVVDGVTVRIYGRVDAIYRLGDKLLGAENKNRKNRLFRTNPDYDIDQLAWDASHGLLHQYHNGKANSTFYSKEFLTARVQELLTAEDLTTSVRELVAYKNLQCNRRQLQTFVERYLLEERRS
jgi:hypothetical protein